SAGHGDGPTIEPTRAHAGSRRRTRNLPCLRLRPWRAWASLVQDLQTLQEIHRSLELDVLLDQLLRSLVAGRQRRGWFAWSPGCRRHLRLFDENVRRDALAVNRPPLRREVLRSREAQPAAIGERDDGLHRPLAEGLRAQDHGSPPVLER